MQKGNIKTLFERIEGLRAPLSPALRKRYGGTLAFPRAPRHRPYIVSNFVSTLDGVVSYHIPGKSGGGEISGFNADDTFVMGLLRAMSDAVVLGSGTLNNDSGHAHVPSVICPPFKKEFAALRRRLGKPQEPLNVILSASGTIQLDKPIFRYPGLKTLIITTDRGVKKLERDYGEKLRITNVISVGKGTTVPPKKVAETLFREYGVRLLVHEGGPTVFGDFLKAGLVDEMFLTFAPQVAGRSHAAPRLSFAGETPFLPDSAPWFRLKSVKAAGGHLLLRYAR